ELRPGRAVVAGGPPGLDGLRAGLVGEEPEGRGPGVLADLGEPVAGAEVRRRGARGRPGLTDLDVAPLHVVAVVVAVDDQVTLVGRVTVELGDGGDVAGAERRVVGRERRPVLAGDRRVAVPRELVRRVVHDRV